MTFKSFMKPRKSEVHAQEEALRSSDPDLEVEAIIFPQDNGSEGSSPASSMRDDSKGQANCPFAFVPLKMGGNGRTHMVSGRSKNMVWKDHVTLKDLEKMTNLFYEKAFQDKILDNFIRSHDDPHGSRFAKWIHQKLTGSAVWDQDRQSRDKTPVELADGYRHVVHDRSSAHAAAWYSPKRPSEEVGRHFQLDECRVWMRLHFWALRESGLMESAPSFSDYYVRFIGHFVSVYERTAPIFTRESLRWSEDPKKIQKYIENSRMMTDVVGLTVHEAKAQLSRDELNDTNWPYSSKP